MIGDGNAVDDVLRGADKELRVGQVSFVIVERNLGR